MSTPLVQTFYKKRYELLLSTRKGIPRHMKFFRKKELWLPTLPGFALMVCLLAGVVGLGASVLYPFLSFNNPRTDVSLIIVEGWIPDALLSSVVALRQPGQKIVTAGGPIQFGGNLFEEKTYAEVSASRLRIAGEHPENIICAPAPPTASDRTYTSALAVRKVLEEQGLYGQSCNLYTLGAHARRSLTLYHAALGTDYPIGVVSLESSEYDLSHWWRSSMAFKHVLSEFVSWVYVKCTPWKYDREQSGVRVPDSAAGETFMERPSPAGES